MKTGHLRLLILTLLFARSAAAQTETVVTGDLSQRLDSFVTEWAHQGFAGAVLVAKNDEVVLLKGYGMADPARAYPNGPGTVFDMGSIVKDFTLAAILKLEEQDRLRVADPLGTFFPEAPKDKAHITVDQVIRMSAGFHQYHDDSGDFQEMSRDEAMQRILAQPLLFKPGTDRAYSNSGYTLLAAIVELVSGESFHGFLRAHLFEPAGMTSTGFYGERTVPDELVASGHGALASYGERNAPQYWPETTWALMGSGGVFGSLMDLYQWHRALREGRVLAGEALERYWAYRSPPADAEGRRVRIMAGGNDFGFVFVFLHLLDEDGLIIFAQNNNPNGEEDPEFVRGLIRVFRD